MSPITIFASVDEVLRIMHDLSIRRDLAGVMKQWKELSLFDPTTDPASYADSVSSKTSFWLFPKGSAVPDPLIPGNMDYRRNGWISVGIGDVTEYKGAKILTESTIQVIDNRELPFRPGGWITQLRKDLVKNYEFENGVLAVRDGVSLEVYTDTSYSPQARLLLGQNVLWKQSVNSNFHFVPVPKDGVEGVRISR